MFMMEREENLESGMKVNLTYIVKWSIKKEK